MECFNVGADRREEEGGGEGWVRGGSEHVWDENLLDNVTREEEEEEENKTKNCSMSLPVRLFFISGMTNQNPTLLYF